jgi:hypothetical protein
VEGKSAKGTGMFQNELNWSASKQQAGALKGMWAPAFYCLELGQPAAILPTAVFSSSECLKKHGKLLKTRLSYYDDSPRGRRCLFEGTNRYSRDGFHNRLIGMFRRLDNAWRCYEK